MCKFTLVVLVLSIIITLVCCFIEFGRWRGLLEFFVLYGLHIIFLLLKYMNININLRDLKSYNIFYAFSMRFENVFINYNTIF